MAQYTHDCTICRFLGTVQDAGNHPVDLYRCAGVHQDSVIARYGSDGPDYSSMPVLFMEKAPNIYANSLLMIAYQLSNINDHYGLALDAESDDSE